MPTAILSVSDKTGLAEFGWELVRQGWTLLATGGTARHLREAGIPVTAVSDVTGSPEILSGRVKTLHPAIHGGLLAQDRAEDRAELADLGWKMIDMVVVNLYPFESTAKNEEATAEDVIEAIDIGGVALIRAAAKNYRRVILAIHPSDYLPILEALENGTVNDRFRQALALKGFAHTAAYDRHIAEYFLGRRTDSLILYPVQDLRYGENPHQPASLWGFQPGQSPLGGTILHGKPLSYNNLLDLDAAWRAVVAFDDPAVVIVKHLSPCGIAEGEHLSAAYAGALASDPVSAFGSVIACNHVVDAWTAEKMGELFIECLAAPAFAPDALETLTRKKNIRLLEMPDRELDPLVEYRSILRGMLRQTIDRGDPVGTEWRVVTQREPTADEWRDLAFAWKACQFIKSNAVLFALNRATLGIGGGQPNRVDCVRMARERAGGRARGAVMASDAFFPFPDSVELAAEAGITAVIQPGGSIRDSLSIEAADAAGMAMVMTGVRHFRH